MSKDIAIGIDLGTSNSCVAAILDGEPQVIVSANGHRTTPSVVGFGEDGSIIVGREAKRRLIRSRR